MLRTTAILVLLLNMSILLSHAQNSSVDFDSMNALLVIFPYKCQGT